MRSIFYTFLFVCLLASCQKPASVTMSSLTSIASSEPKWTPLRTMAVGLEAPTWDFAKKLAAESTGPSSIDDTYTRIKTSQKVIAMTFDDGPVLSNTTRLLDMLKQRNIKATFFVVGEMVRNNPQLLRRMIAEGHEIGNHTVNHGNLARMGNDALIKELTRAHQQILAATGVPPRCMRPPGGAITSKQKKLMFKELGYPTILWSCDPKDWQKPGVSVVTRRLLDGASPGGILLAHDLHKSTVDAMPQTLDVLLSRGYRFVTVSNLISMDESKKP